VDACVSWVAVYPAPVGAPEGGRSLGREAVFVAVLQRHVIVGKPEDHIAELPKTCQFADLSSVSCLLRGCVCVRSVCCACCHLLSFVVTYSHLFSLVLRSSVPRQNKLALGFNKAVLLTSQAWQPGHSGVLWSQAWRSGAVGQNARAQARATR
jgi:hypothetical protein